MDCYVLFWESIEWDFPRKPTPLKMQCQKPYMDPDERTAMQNLCASLHSATRRAWRWVFGAVCGVAVIEETIRLSFQDTYSPHAMLAGIVVIGTGVLGLCFLGVLQIAETMTQPPQVPPQVLPQMPQLQATPLNVPPQIPLSHAPGTLPVLCLHDEVQLGMAAVLGAPYVQRYEGHATHGGPLYVKASRAPLRAIIHGFLANMATLAGNPAAVSVSIAVLPVAPPLLHRGKRKPPQILLKCRITNTSAAHEAVTESALTHHWRELGTRVLVPQPGSGSGLGSGSLYSKLTPAAASHTASRPFIGEYAVPLAVHEVILPQGPVGLLGMPPPQWTAVVLVDDDMVMHYWFRRHCNPAVNLHLFPSATSVLQSARTADCSMMVAPTVLIFLDLLLPDGDGRDVCRILRHEHHSTAVIVAVTSLSPSDPTASDTHLTYAGFDAVVRKPVAWKTIQALLTQCVCGVGVGVGVSVGNHGNSTHTTATAVTSV
jgi:CheY-like chemotaxis protein